MEKYGPNELVDIMVPNLMMTNFQRWPEGLLQQLKEEGRIIHPENLQSKKGKLWMRTVSSWVSCNLKEATRWHEFNSQRHD